MILLSCWLGYLSWRWIETPFREKHWLASRKAIFSLFGLYALVCISLGGLYVLLNGRLVGKEDVVPKPTRSFTYEADIEDPNLVLPGLGDKTALPTFLLWGDSHAMSSAAPILDRLGKEVGVRGLQLTDSSKAPLVTWGYVPNVKKKFVSQQFKEKWSGVALETVSSQKLRVVFLVGFWENYARPSFAQELQQTIEEFHRRGARVIFVADNPSLPKDPQRQVRLAAYWPWISSPTPVPSQLHREKNRVVDDTLRKIPSEADVTVVDLATIILEWNSLTSENGRLLYFDDDHLSDEGALMMRPLFEPVFSEMKARSR